MSTTDAQRYAWLHGSSMRAASDACLGLILLIAGAVAIRAASVARFGSESYVRAAYNYPLVIAWLLLAVGIATLLRALVLRKVEHTPGVWEA